MSVAVSYRLFSQNLTRSMSVTANQAPVKLESEYYQKHASSITSLEEFLADTRLFRFAMTAFGLADLAYAKGYIRKILEEGISDPESLANRTNDPRITEFARTFDFESFGEDTMRRTATGEEVITRYIRQTLEVEAGEQDGDGVRLALYFERQAPEIRTAFDILADSALLEVVRVTLGLPQAFSAARIQRQAAVIEDRIDIESFKDPEALRAFLVRFTAVWDATEEPLSDPILALFSPAIQSAPNVSLDLMLSLQNIRLGGA